MTWRYAEINVATAGFGPQQTITLNFATSTLGAASLVSDPRYHRNAALALVESAGARFQCGTDGLVKGILLERGNTGYLRKNNLFATADGWTHSGVSVASAVQPDIFAGSTAFEFEESGAGSIIHNISRNLTDDPADIPDNVPVCLWAIVKHVDMDYVMLQFLDKANRSPSQMFNIHPDSPFVHTAQLDAATQYSAGMEYLGGDWRLIWASFDTASDASAVNPSFGLHAVNAAGDASTYTIAGTRSFIVTAAGANRGTYPQLFFPVGAAHVTKAADVLTLGVDNQADNDFYHQFVLYARDRSQLAGTVPESYLYRSGDYSVRITDTNLIAGVTGAELSAAHGFVPGARHVVGVGKGPTQGLQLVVDGVEIEASTDPEFLAAITPGTMHIGSDENGENHADCVLESFEIGVWE